MRFRPAVTRTLLLLAVVIAILSAGCAQYTDASDTESHYYKGKQFVHKRTTRTGSRQQAVGNADSRYLGSHFTIACCLLPAADCPVFPLDNAARL